MSYNKFSGRKSNIGTSAVRISNDEMNRPNIGVQIIAPSSNSTTVYVGFTNSITTDSDDSTDGFPLVAGSSVLIHDVKPYDIWVIGDGAGPSKVFFIGV